MRTLHRWVAVMTVVLAVTGCMSTPERRIKNEPGVFAAFPALAQEKIRRGEIEIGFTKDMVRLALGRPHRTQTRITEAGGVDIWVYTGIRYISHFEPVDDGYWYRDRAGRLHRSYETLWIDHGYNQEFPVLRVEFVGNAVKAIERMQR